MGKWRSCPTISGRLAGWWDAPVRLMAWVHRNWQPVIGVVALIFSVVAADYGVVTRNVSAIGAYMGATDLNLDEEAVRWFLALVGLALIVHWWLGQHGYLSARVVPPSARRPVPGKPADEV